jgi:hypothetical protein
MEYNIFVMNDSFIPMLEELKEDALNDGYRIVKRTIEQWKDKTNRFSSKKEVLYGVEEQGKIIAIGGINIDPYLMDDEIGRIRHIYVHSEHRNKGIATALLEKILLEKEKEYKVIRLSTKNEAAMSLYEAYGFKKVVEYKATHIKVISKSMFR